MHVDFTQYELQLLTDTLMRHNRDLLLEIARTDRREFRQMLQQKLDLLTDLQGQILRGELWLSETARDVLNEMLDRTERALYFEIARTDHRGFKQLLRKDLECMELLHCKLAEGCAVV
jgi:hypothetical protein